MTQQSLIIVPIDWSEQSLIALDQACSVAKTFNQTLHLLHVKDGQGIFKTASAKAFHEEEEKAISEHLHKTADELKEKWGIEVSFEIRTGKIYDQITEVAEEKESSFIIMGTSGSVGIKRFIGSNALRVVKESKVPVITIKGKHHSEGCKIIVLPLDLTKETREKVGKAIDFAKSFGSEIHVISVFETSDEYTVNHLERQLAQVHRYIEDHGVKAKSDIIEKNGTVAKTIIDHSNAIKADLLMIMTQQENDFTDLFIGSQAQAIINQSDIPVLSIVPRPTESNLSSIFQ